MASYGRAGTNLYDLVDRFFNDGFSVNTPLKNIILDVQEFDDKYIVEADVPGVDKKDIHVTFNNDYLKISLEKNDDKNKDETKNTESATSTNAEVNANYTDGPDKTDVKVDGDTGEHETTDDTSATDDGPSDHARTKGPDDGSHYIHRERMFATVNRVIYLKGAMSKGIKANLSEGVLTLVVPKREDAMNQVHTIEID